MSFFALFMSYFAEIQKKGFPVLFFLHFFSVFCLRLINTSFIMDNKNITFSVDFFFKVDLCELSSLYSVQDSDDVCIRFSRFVRSMCRAFNFVSYNSAFDFEVKSVDLDDSSSFVVCEMSLSSDNYSCLRHMISHLFDVVENSIATGLHCGQIRRTELLPYDF